MGLRAYRLVLTLCLLFSRAGYPAGEHQSSPSELVESAHRIAVTLDTPVEQIQALGHVAASYADIGETSKAAEAFEQAAAAASASADDPGAVVQLADTFAASGHYEWAYRLTACVPQEPARGAAQSGPSASRALTSRYALRCKIVRLATGNGALDETVGILQDWLSEVRGREGGHQRAAALGQIAQYLAAARRTEMARDVFIETIAAALRCPDSPRRKNLLLETGVSFARACGYPAAEATVLALPDPHLRAEVLLAAANQYLRTGRDREVEALLARAHESALRIEDSGQRASVLVALARALVAVGRNDSAQARLGEAVDLMRVSDSPAETAKVVLPAIGLYSGLNQMVRARELADGIEHDGTRWSGYYQIALAYVRQGRHEDALSLGELILSDSLKSAIYRVVAEELCRQGRIDSALVVCLSAKTRAARDGAVAVVAEAMASAGRLDEALSAAETIVTARLRGHALEGLIETALSRPDDSGKHLESARRAAARLPSASQPAMMCQVADAYLEAGRTNEAVDALSEALEKAEGLSDSLARARGLHMIARSFEKAGRRDKATEIDGRIPSLIEFRTETCTDLMREGMLDLAARLADGISNAYLRSDIYCRLAVAYAEAGQTRGLQTRGLSPLPRSMTGSSPLPGRPASDAEDMAGKMLRAATSALTDVSLPLFQAKGLARIAAAARRSGIDVPTEFCRSARLMAEAAEAGRQGSPARAAEPGQIGPHLGAKLAYFHQGGCGACRRLTPQIERLQKELPWVEIRSYDVGRDPEARTLLSALCEKAGVAVGSPAVFSAEKGLVKEQITSGALIEMALSAGGLPAPWRLSRAELAAARGSLLERYRSLSFVGVASFGLLDGVNPCAFTVIIFFVSYLAYLGRTRREIALGGITFTAAVFLTYLAIGLGLYRVLDLGESWSSHFGTITYVVTACFALAMGVWSFRDGIRCARGNVKDATLKLPEVVRSSIRRIITRKARLGLTLGATLLLGAAVALFEFPCTGQVYWPVIAAIHQVGFHARALELLLVYNLCFVLPLIAIFLCVYLGLGSQYLTKLFRRHMVKTKFALGFVFMFLFAFLVVYALYA